MMNKDIDSLIKKLKSINNFAYDFVNVEYDSERNCSRNRRCSDGHCRCSKIKNVTFEPKLNELVKLCDKNKFLQYAFDRLLRIHNAYSQDFWEAEISPGYYGQELGCVTGDFGKIFIDLQNLETLSDIEMVKYVLSVEYGYLLSDIEATNTATIKNVPLKDILQNNTEYRKKVSKEDSSFYEDYNLPVGVCLKKDSGIRLIDGYHRLAQATYQNKKKVDVIILE